MTRRAVGRAVAVAVAGLATVMGLVFAVVPTTAGAASTLSVATTTLPSAMADQGYSASLAASGGTTPYTWSISKGQLPTGLSLATNGDITGIPTTAGTSTFTVEVTDSSTPTPETATKTLTISVNKGVISVCDAAHLSAAVAAGGSYGFSCSGTIVVTKPLTLDGQTVALDGTGQSVAISGGGVSQIFVVETGSTLTLDHLTLTDGAATSSTVVQEGQPGQAGTRGSQGFPVLPYCCADGGTGGPGTAGTAGGNGQKAGDAKGGALEVDQGGTAVVTGVTFSNDTATGGTGANGGDGGAGGAGGDGGYGGSTCVVTAKTPAEDAWSGGGGGEGGNGGDGGDGGDGGAAHGGAIANAGTMSVSNATFVDDGATGGGGGSGGAAGIGGTGGSGGTGGLGGLANGGDGGKGGAPGDPGTSGTGGNGGDASGGAIYNTGSLEIDASAFTNDGAVGGDGGVGGKGGNGGPGGDGGGWHSQMFGPPTVLYADEAGGSIGFYGGPIYVGYYFTGKYCSPSMFRTYDGGTPTVTVTFTGGKGGSGADGSDGGDGGDGGNGGNGDGAAIFSSGAITATGLTFTGGQATGGRGGQGGDGGYAGPGGQGGDGGYVFQVVTGSTQKQTLSAAGVGGICKGGTVTHLNPSTPFNTIALKCPDTPTAGVGGVGGSPGGTLSGQPGTAGGGPVTGETGTAGTTLHGCVRDKNATCVGGQGGDGGKSGAAGNGGTGGSAGGGGASDLSGCPLSNGAASCGATVPPPPTGVLPIVTLGTSGKPQVDLSWTPPAADGGSAITGYDVYRSTTSGVQGSLIAQGVKTPSYDDTSVSAGTVYYYEIAAVNGVGVGAASVQGQILVTASAEVQGISGKVTDAATGAPLEGVCAYLYTVTGKRTTDPGVCTDATGDYLMPVARTGSYVVAFLDPSGGHVTWYGGASAQSAAEVVTVLPGATTPNIDAALSEVQGISGTVTDAVTGAPLPGICAYAYTTAGERTADPSVCTGTSGEYLLPVATAGTYDVAFIDPTSLNVTTWYGGATSQAAASAVTVTTGKTVTGIDVAMDEVQGVTGTVTNAVTGEPLPGICAYLYTTTGQRTSDPGACTGTSGAYVLPVATPGTYALAFVDPTGKHPTTWSGGAATESGAAPVDVASGTMTRSVDVAIDEVQGIAGTVTDAVTGNPLSGVCAYLYTTTGQRTTDPGVCTTGGQTAGTYLLPVATPGSYVVAFVDPTSTHQTTWSGGSLTEAGAARVTVAAGTTTAGVDVQMGELQGIAGDVLFLGAFSAFATYSATSSATSSVCLYLYTTTGQRTTAPGVCTTGSGKFVMPVSSPGEYLLAAVDSSGLNQTTWYATAATGAASGTTAESGATPITVTAGETVDVTMAMVETQAIDGTVTDLETGAPIPGTCVYAYTTAGQRTSDPGVCTNASGDFVLPIATPGTYLLAFVPPSGKYVTDWYDASAVGTGETGGRNEKLATPVAVSANRAAFADAKVSPPDAISGAIVNAATGEPYAGVCVYADYGPLSLGSGQYAGVGSCTGSNGVFDLTTLGNGYYRLGFYLPGQAQGTGAPPTTYWYGATGTVVSSEATAATVLAFGGSTSSGIDVTLPT